MQIFELHFNPKLKDDKLFDSFIYEPENAYEKKLGSLYIVGEIQNALPSDSRFLDNLAKLIKSKYYTFSLKTPEKALSESLKKTNEFLEEEVKKENVSWLGNLNLAVLSLKDFNLIFSKTGDLKVLLLRGNQVIDIGKNLEPGEIEPYPLKVFFNVVSGQLVEDDKILVLTKNIFDFFQQQKTLDKIIKAENLDEKKIKEILPPQLFNEDANLKLCGIAFLVVVKESISAKELPRQLQFKRNKKSSIFKNFLPSVKNLKKILPSFSPFKKLKGKPAKSKKDGKYAGWQIWKKVGRCKKIPLKLISTVKVKVGILKLPLVKNLLKGTRNRKNLILIIVLILSLLAGFLIFKGRGDNDENEIKNSIDRIEDKVFQAETFLIFKNEEKANSLYKEAWMELGPLLEKQNSFKAKLLSLKESIEKRFGELSKMENIENPEIFLELKLEETGLEPGKMITSGKNFYFYNPDSFTLYRYDSKEKKSFLFSAPQNLKIGAAFSNSVIFLSPPDGLLYLYGDFWQEKNIQLPSFSINFSHIAPYEENLYFLDAEKFEIIKYARLSSGEWSFPLVWFKDKAPAQKKPRDFTIDGSVWVLNENNSVDLYKTGKYQKTITLDFFPFPENLTKIKTRVGLPYLYLLEPSKKRVIVIDKSGKIVKQFQSEKFDNLKDFEVSDNGKTIYLLNGTAVYQVNL